MKKVLLIGYKDSKVYGYLNQNEDMTWIDGSEVITLERIQNINPEFIVLHGCHSILSKDIVQAYNKKIINCHGGYLPWNRGAHPNVWSAIDKTPKGGTVHYIDEFIDKGEIIERREICFSDDDTLSTSYWKIRDLLDEVFIENWPNIKNGTVKPVNISNERGNLHFRKDLAKVEHLLKDGWDTKLKDL